MSKVVDVDFHKRYAQFVNIFAIIQQCKQYETTFMIVCRKLKILKKFLRNIVRKLTRPAILFCFCVLNTKYFF